MSTPKIKVYRLDKGYNQDADNDIQTKVNSEVLPFIEKKSKPTDAYYLTAVSDQKIQWNGEKINLTPKIIDAPVVGTTSGKIDCSGWVKKGYFRPKVGYVKIENEQDVFYELASSKKNEEELLKDIEKVNKGEISKKPYFTQESFIYAHPFVFTDLEDACYEITIEETIEETIEKYYLSFVVNEEKIIDEFGAMPVDLTELKIKYYEKDNSSISLYLENYPVYNHSNYFYNPQIFAPQKISLSINTTKGELYRNSQEIECDDTWIYYGNGSPIVTCDKYILEKKDYELIYSFNNNTRTLRVKISEEYLTNHQSGYYLHYNTDSNTESTLISEYEIDSNTGKITFDAMPENFFVYYYQKVQRATTFVSENVNWSFGHLRENPDVFFGEKDYPGDEKEDAETGTPLYSGMKPSFIKEGFQIDYMRGSISFTDGYKSIYKSEVKEAENLQYRDTTSPETFVRANYSYYPEVFGVFRQKMEMVSDVDGYTYKPVYDLRYPNSIGKRWIMKNDNYQPMFFENWTDKVNVCSQYLTTAPNYDKLNKKSVIEISDSDLENNTDKLTFILPLIESQFIVFKTIEDEINPTINVNDETFDLKIMKQEDGSFYVGVNEEELQQGEVANISATKTKIEIVYLYSSQSNETKKKTFSFQIVSIKNI